MKEYEQHIKAFHDYLLYERRYSKHTIAAYMNDLNQFTKFIDAKHLSIYKITQKDFRNFLKFLNDAHISKISVRRKVSSIQRFYNFMIEIDSIQSSPIENLVLPKVSKRLPEVIYSKEIEKLLNFSRGTSFIDVRNQIILELLYGLGIRVSELCKIKLHDIYYNEKIILVVGKGNKERYIPYGNHVQRALETYRLQRQKITTTSNELILNTKMNAITPRGITYVLNEEAKRCNLGIHIHPHKFRHTYATDLLNEGASLRAVQELLGHADLSSTQIYTHISTSKLQSAYLKSHPRSAKQNIKPDKK